MLYRTLVAIPVILIACHPSAKSTAGRYIEAARSDSLVGYEAVGKSDCLSCHRTHGKFIGPSFSEIAGKYQLTGMNVDLLSQKVIKGGSGSWGIVPMTPHPKLSALSAAMMIKYILLNKND